MYCNAYAFCYLVMLMTTISSIITTVILAATVTIVITIIATIILKGFLLIILILMNYDSSACGDTSTIKALLGSPRSSQLISGCTFFFSGFCSAEPAVWGIFACV